MAGGSKTAVYCAIGANSIVAIAKFGAFAFTGSGAMLSEGIHSVADVGNQCLLALGLARSHRPADDSRPYGYDQERFVWALISAVGIFFLGCGVTVYHGIHSLMAGHEMQETSIALWVLAFSFVIEGASLGVAVHALRGEARSQGLTLMAYARSGKDPTGTAILLEDGAAVFGVMLAALCICLGIWTGQPWWDGVGSILIGLLLGWVAIWLINKNREALVGRGVSTETRSKVIKVLESDPVVDEVADIKATMVGKKAFRFKAEIEFNGSEITRRWLQSQDIDSLAKRAAEPGEFENVMTEMGDAIVDALGDEIDRIEQKIQAAVPAAQHGDIEAD